MRVRVRSLIGVAVLAGAVLSGCRSETSVAPASSAVSLKKVKNQKTSDTVNVVTRKAPFTSDVTVSGVIGANGGTLSLPAAGLTLIVPRGAVSSNQTFSITALSGAGIAYEFTPHMTFAQPLQLEQETDLFNLPSDVSTVTAGYFANRADLGATDDDVGTIEEELPLTIDLSKKKARFDVTHFSGYLMASGRSGR